MFTPIKADEYWGVNASDSWFYTRASNPPLKPYYCTTSRKWVIVWNIIPFDIALQVSRDYKRKQELLLKAHTAVAMHIENKRAWALAKRMPVLIWEQEVITPEVLEAMVERTDPYHPSAFPVWEKYPHLTNSVYQTVIHWLMTYKWNPKLLDYVLCYPIPFTLREKMLRAGIELPALLDEYSENKAKSKLLFQGYEMQARDAMVKAATITTREINSFSNFGARGPQKESKLDHLRKVSNEIEAFSQFTGRDSNALNAFAMLHAMEENQLLGDISSVDK